MNNALLDILLPYDAWATRQLLVECTALSPEQFTQQMEVGTGSLERTAAHLVGAELFFAARFSRCPPGPRPDGDGRHHTAAELLAQFDAAAPELEAAVREAIARHDLTDPLQWTDTDAPGVPPEDCITYAVALAHMFQHGVEHRTEAVEILRRLGVTKRLNWTPFGWDWYQKTGENV